MTDLSLCVTAPVAILKNAGKRWNMMESDFFDKMRKALNLFQDSTHENSKVLFHHPRGGARTRCGRSHGSTLDR
jgi:hypothetical protein